ncbi:MAG: spore cortex biosynthesis protein YabQ [Eubacteriales bacterium]|nr:spore cortex biosynthesis protein YabQ [Eubacteriales bacterium]
MAEIITRQAELFLYSVGYGILLGVWYELFRTLRKTFVHRDGAVHVEDVLFCVVGTAGLFLLFQRYNQGQMRFYVLAGIGAGGLFYFLMLSWIVQNIFMFFWKLFLKLPGKVLERISRPIRIIVNSMVLEYNYHWQKRKK